MKIFLEILFIIVSHSPIIWELASDWNGDFNKKSDVFVRIGMAVAVSVASWLIVGHSIISAFFLCIALHFFIFDYVIAHRLIRKGFVEPPRGEVYHWFSYLGKKGVVDNISIWREMNPWWRFVIRTTVLTAALIIYF